MSTHIMFLWINKKNINTFIVVNRALSGAMTDTMTLPQVFPVFLKNLSTQWGN